MHRIMVATPGGPEAMQLESCTAEAPAAGEILVRHRAVGVNMIDTYHRAGIYPLPMPTGIGMEAAGIVEAAGEGVTNVDAGDRVVYFAASPGSYATHRVVPANAVVRLPDEVAEDIAAAVWLKACTVEFLVERCARVRPGQLVLVTAAAGGVGLLLVQWLKAVGAQVIGVVSSGKEDAARGAGADDVLGYDDMPGRVREISAGRGADVVIDGVGKATFGAALDSLCRRGLHISFGNASGPIGPVDFSILASKGSLFTTRPTLFDYYADPKDFAAGTGRVLEMLRNRRLDVTIGQRYPLADAARCHRDLEARRTVGSTILLP
ncbi:MAG: quinone oxidoreductase family protein [Thermaurantiacus sp.]